MVKYSKSGWTDEDVALLKKMWFEPGSAQKIGMALSVRRTRSAVIGKADRLGLGPKPYTAPESRKKTRGLGIQVKKVRKPKAKAEKPKIEKPPEPLKPKIELVPEGQAALPARPETVVATLDLKRGMCRWPYGDPTQADFGHCGCRADYGVYCISHARVAYVPPERRAATRPMRVYTRRRA
uniref:GcrA cell cycle regulator n=1 Tax=Caulobacter phage BL57 TaxID=3348355 RepID=A0AB74UIK5_9VIRU